MEAASENGPEAHTFSSRMPPESTGLIAAEIRECVVVVPRPGLGVTDDVNGGQGNLRRGLPSLPPRDVRMTADSREVLRLSQRGRIVRSVAGSTAPCPWAGQREERPVFGRRFSASGVVSSDGVSGCTFRKGRSRSIIFNVKRGKARNSLRLRKGPLRRRTRTINPARPRPSPGNASSSAAEAALRSSTSRTAGRVSAPMNKSPTTSK